MMPPSYSDEDGYGSDVNYGSREDTLDDSFTVSEKGTSVTMVGPFLKCYGN